MSVTASLLQTLHRINRQKTDLQGQLARGPRVVSMSKGKFSAAEKQVQDIREEITRMKMEADSKQLQMKEREDKIRHWQGQLNAAKENREYQALKDQIAADTQANAVLSDEILEILEGLDAMAETLKQAEANSAAMKSDFDKIETQVEQKRLLLEADLKRVEAELLEAERGLSGDFKRDYERLDASKGEDAMAELEGKCCGGCYQSLTPQILERLSMGQPVVCPACGRLIYQDSDR